MRTLQSQITWCTRAHRTLGAIALVSVVCFFFLGFQPQSRRLRDLQALTLKHERQLIENQEKAADRNEIAASNERLKQELDLIKKPTKQDDFALIINELTEAKNRSALRRYFFDMGASSMADLFFEQRTKLDIEGDFVSVFSFLRNIEDMPRLTRLRSITLKSKDKTSGVVQASVALNFYFSTGDSGGW